MALTSPTQDRTGMGMLLAAAGVLLFSGTFPATLFALRGFDSLTVGAGRSVGAAVLAGVTLRVAGVRRPTRRQLRILLNVVPGVGVGFGVLTAVALQHVSGSHAAVVTGLLPVATAAVAVWRGGERASWLFWATSAVGAVVVVAFAMRRGVGQLGIADALLLLALLLAAVGYAEGARLTRELPGWQVISWTMVLALPISLPLSVVATLLHPPHLDGTAVAGLVYVATASTFFGFFAWYRGLAMAGIARASQLQLAQPFLTIALSAWLLGERPDGATYLTAGAVLLLVLLAQRARFARG